MAQLLREARVAFRAAEDKAGIVEVDTALIRAKANIVAQDMNAARKVTGDETLEGPAVLAHCGGGMEAGGGGRCPRRARRNSLPIDARPVHHRELQNPGHKARDPAALPLPERNPASHPAGSGLRPVAAAHARGAPLFGGPGRPRQGPEARRPFQQVRRRAAWGDVRPCPTSAQPCAADARHERTQARAWAFGGPNGRLRSTLRESGRRSLARGHEPSGGGDATRATRFALPPSETRQPACGPSDQREAHAKRREGFQHPKRRCRDLALEDGRSSRRAAAALLRRQEYDKARASLEDARTSFHWAGGADAELRELQRVLDELEVRSRCEPLESCCVSLRVFLHTPVLGLHLASPRGVQMGGSGGEGRELTLLSFYCHPG